MKPTERHTVTAHFPGEKIPLVFTTFDSETLERELKSLKEMGYDKIETKSEDI